MRYRALFHPLPFVYLTTGRHSLKGPIPMPTFRTPKPLVSDALIAWVFSLPMPVPSCAGPAPAPKRNVVAEFILNQG